MRMFDYIGEYLIWRTNLIPRQIFLLYGILFLVTFSTMPSVFTLLDIACPVTNTVARYALDVNVCMNGILYWLLHQTSVIT